MKCIVELFGDDRNGRKMIAWGRRIGYVDAGRVCDAERRKVAQTFRPRFHTPRRFAILFPAMLGQSFTEFIFATNTDGSGKAASYVRALDMLGPILTKHYPKPIVGGSTWHGFSLADIYALREWICAGDKKKSYRQQLAGDSENGCCQALFYVRCTIQNGRNRDVLRRRRSAIYRDSVQVEEREGGEMTKRGNLVVRYDGLHPREDYTSSCYYYWECDVWRLFSIGSLIEMLNKVRGQ